MEENKLLRGALYVVGTPIGNLSDFSPRAAETLAAVDFIAAEDTRVTMKLLNHFGIKKPLVSYYEHNKAEKGGRIVDRILAGETCAIGLRRRHGRPSPTRAKTLWRYAPSTTCRCLLCRARAPSFPRWRYRDCRRADLRLRAF